MIGITASYINPMESEIVYIALFLHQGLDIYLYCEFVMVINDVVVVVVNLYSHSECMQHVSRNRVRTGKQPKKHKIK